MEAEELRLGNIVKFEDRNFPIGGIFKYNVYDNTTPNWSGYIPITQIKGVPLTEDWLVKFGFECKESSTCKLWHIGINDLTHDYLFDLTWLIKPELINAPDFPFYKNGRHTIYFVHQLQNLYFALTGIELKID